MNRRKWVWLAVLAAATVGLLAWQLRKWNADLHSYPWDAKVDWLAARAFLDGVNPYSYQFLHAAKLDGLGHPPTTSFWMLPFAGLTLQAMKIPFDATVMALLLASLLLVLRELRVPLWWANASALFVALCSTSWMHYHIHLAQVSALIAFFLVVAWLLARRKHDFLAGLVLGFACTIKFFPGLLGLALVLHRRWRVLLGGIAGYVPIFLLMTLRFGFEAWPQYFASEKIIVRMWIAHPHNCSLYGVLMHVFWPTCRGFSYPTAAGNTIATDLAVALILGALVFTYRAIADARFDLAWVLLIVVSVFANPFCFEHYFVLLIFPVVVAFYWAYQLRSRAALALLIAIVPLLGNYIWAMNDARSAHMHYTAHLFEVIDWIHMPLLIFTLGLLVLRANEVK
jgi:hypothetical protein